MPTDEPVTRASLSRRLQPIVVPRPLSLLPDRIWSDEEWERIRLGYRARDMDEKWNVFAEGNVVHLHRSWTGHGVVEATFTPSTAAAGRSPRRWWSGTGTATPARMTCTTA